MSNITLWLLLIVLCIGSIASLLGVIRYISLIYKTDQENSVIPNKSANKTKELPEIRERDFLIFIELVKNIQESNFVPQTKQNDTKHENVIPFTKPNITSELTDNLNQRSFNERL